MADMLLQNRAEDMAGIKDHMSLIRNKSHTVELYPNNGAKMKEGRVKATELINNQIMKSGNFRTDERFDFGIVTVEDIQEDGVYYSGFMFILSSDEGVFRLCRMTASADASHCQVVGAQSYGKIFEVVVYDAKHHLMLDIFYHSSGK